MQSLEKLITAGVDAGLLGKWIASGRIGDLPPAWTTETSNQIVEESGENLQPRPSTPDVPMPGLPPVEVVVLDPIIIGAKSDSDLQQEIGNLVKPQ